MSKPRDALARLREARALVCAASDLLNQAETDLEAAVASPAEYPLQGPMEDLPEACDHRRAHRPRRPRRPAKLDADVELRAFILARIDALTFPQLEEEVAKAFPPARRIGKSAIHAWWAKHRKARAAKSHPE